MDSPPPHPQPNKSEIAEEQQQQQQRYEEEEPDLVSARDEKSFDADSGQPFKEESQKEEGNDDGEEAEEDEDDFGEFEEAPSHERGENPQEKRPTDDEEQQVAGSSGSGTWQQQQQADLPSFLRIFGLSIARLANHPQLWEVETPESSSSSASQAQQWLFLRPCANSGNCPELFLQMDIGSEADTRQLQAQDSSTMLNAFHLWTQICYVEEVPALQFQWLSSQTCRHLLWALQLRKNSHRPRRIPATATNAMVKAKLKPEHKHNKQTGKEETVAATSAQKQPPSLTSSAPEPTCENEKSAAATMRTPAPAVDSLMVPPADFDWRSSGLANPLTGKAVAQAAAATPVPTAVFDCSAFLLDNNGPGQKVNNASAGTAMDSAALLERDLQAFGLLANNNSKVAAAVNKSDGPQQQQQRVEENGRY